MSPIVHSWNVIAVTFTSKIIFLLVCSQVSVALSSGSIRVAMLEENGERVLMEGKLTHKINTENSLWSLEPGRCVLVSVGRRKGRRRRKVRELVMDGIQDSADAGKLHYY